jgi:hypothetical protein
VEYLYGSSTPEISYQFTDVEGILSPAARKGMVSKADLEQYLDANQIQIQEVLHGQDPSVPLIGTSPSYRRREEFALPTKFSDPAYQLPGGENYRELVLTLPSVAPVKGTSKAQWMIDTGRAQNMPEAARLLDSGRYDQEWTQANQADYLGGHYDEPNIVAHIRFNERVDADGNKVLFIEEIQSDWAQKGREKGFQTESLEEVERLAYADKDRFYSGRKPDMSDEEWKALSQRVKEWDQREATAKSGVPSAPFIMDTNQWVALSLKRMVRWAADNKFDKIGWTTGAQQAARYDLSKQVKRVYYLDDGTLRAIDHSGNTVIDKRVPKEKVTDYIGKEAAEKLFNTKKTVVWADQNQKIEGHNLSGIDLQVGGEGMKGFYDQIITNQAKALGKKYGAKVEMGGVNVTSRIHHSKSFDVSFPYEIRDATGQPLDSFSSRDAAEDRIQDMDRFAESFGTPPFTIVDLAEEIRPEPVWTLNLTHQLKDAARKGLPYMVVLPPVVIGSQMMQEEAPVPEAPVEVPAAQVRASRILEEAVL